MSKFKKGDFVYWIDSLNEKNNIMLQILDVDVNNEYYKVRFVNSQREFTSHYSMRAIDSNYDKLTDDQKIALL